MVIVVMVIVVMVLLTMEQALLVVSLCYQRCYLCWYSNSCEQSPDPCSVSSYIAISIKHSSSTRSI